MQPVTGVIRTVLGDIEPRELGRTNVHEHLLMRSPLLRGEELDDREKSSIEATEMRRAGIDALIELTPIGLGRDPEGVAHIAEDSGLHIVLATGIHREAHYPPEHWIHRTGTDELAELFVRDIVEGWTVGLVRECVGAIASHAEADPNKLLMAATKDAGRAVVRAKHAVEDIERDLRNMSRERLLPDEKTLEKVARYEAHLSRGLYKALHELEALQARRTGGAAPLARLDVDGLAGS